MRNKYLLYSLFAATALTVGSCDYNEDNFPGYDELSHPTDVRTDTITLTSSDYSAIANLAANQDIALSQDPEGQTYLNALTAVGTNKYFTDDAPIGTYMPAYLETLYRYLDNDSKVTVNYNYYQDLPGYLKDLNGITDYQLSSSDYRNVWGGSISATYLTPSTVRQIPAILANAISNPADGAMKLVSYVYSETEPSTGGGEAVPMVYRKVNELDAAGGRYVIAAQAPDGTYYPFGKLDKESYNYGYMNPAPINVTDNIISNDEGEAQVMEIGKTDNGYSLLNTWGQYVYNSTGYNNFNVSTSFPSSGGEWTITPNGNGTFAITNATTGKTIKLYPYNDSYSFACYASSIFEVTTYYNETLAEGQGDLKIQDVSLGEGMTYAWTYDNGYSCMKAGAFINGANVPSESWLVTPEIDLTDANNPAFSADMALNFLKGANRADFVSVMVSTNYADDVTTATWEELELPTWPEGNNWTFVNSGEADLSAYKGEKIHIAFKYVSTAATATTWEIKNLLVKEAGQSNYWDVCLFQEVPETEAMSAMTKATTRSAADVNASAVYRYDANNDAWSQYTSNDASIAVVQPADYEQMGKDYVSNPTSTLPIFLSQKYPYAQPDDEAAVVYYNSDGDIAAIGFTYNGATWTETTVATPAVTTFKKMNGTWMEVLVYLESSLLDGESGGFVAQNVELSGLNYVWTLDASYGWKASGYANYTNNKTDSWLVSPELDLTKGINPQLSFDIAINYLRGNDRAQLFNVVVLTNYNGDATTATQEVLELEGWPEGMSWSFTTMGPVDMSAYNGKKIRLAFHYVSTESVAPTIEVKNISFKEVDE